MVRVEIETALSLGLTVIPVLLGGAALPTGALLPGKLAGLSSLHASEIRRDPDFHKDMDKLIGDLRRNALRPLSLRRRFTRAGVVLSLALGVFAIGVVGAIWTLKTAERVEAQQDENRRQRVLAELGLDGQTADDNSASIRLIELLGEPADGATQREYQGRFEAVGLNPYWAMQLRDDRVVFQLDHGAEFESYAGARPEFYQGGLAIPFENNGTYYSFVVRNEPCQLMNGVETDYTAYAVVDRVVFSGCASRGLSGDWPFDRAGAERWGLSPPDAHD